MRANLPIGSTSANAQPNGNWFARLAVATSRISGRPTTFLLAVAVVLVWAITGPLFGFSDTWQLVASQDVGEFVARNIPDSRMIVLDATGHCPNLSAPDEVIAAMRTFI
jgi:pimeloyl-ACP methyl ester carboxylesterase